MNPISINAVVAVIGMLLGVVWIAHDIYVIYELFAYNMALIDFIWSFFLVNVVYFVVEFILLCIGALCASEF